MIPLPLGRTRLFFWSIPFAFGVMLSKKRFTSWPFLADEGKSTSWNNRMRRKSATRRVVGSKLGCKYSVSSSILSLWHFQICWIAGAGVEFFFLFWLCTWMVNGAGLNLRTTSGINEWNYVTPTTKLLRKWFDVTSTRCEALAVVQFQEFTQRTYIAWDSILSINRKDDIHISTSTDSILTLEEFESRRSILQTERWQPPLFRNCRYNRVFRYYARLITTFNSFNHLGAKGRRSFRTDSEIHS